MTTYGWDEIRMTLHCGCVLVSRSKGSELFTVQHRIVRCASHSEPTVCRVHDADDVVPGRICGRALPCKEHP